MHKYVVKLIVGLRRADLGNKCLQNIVFSWGGDGFEVGFLYIALFVLELTL